MPDLEKDYGCHTHSTTETVDVVNGDTVRSADFRDELENKYAHLSGLDKPPFVALKRSIRATYMRYPLLAQCAAEFWSTFFMLIFGVCSVSAAAIMGAQQGIWQVAVVWGFGVTLSIYCAGPISGAHMNPAVSLAFAILRPHDFPAYKVIPYSIAQLLGGTMAGVFNLLIYNNAITYFEKQTNIVRGSPASVRTAMAFGEYFPNPAMYPGNDTMYGVVGAFFVEAFGTAVLMFFILSLTSPALPKSFRDNAAPFFIGFTVASLISLFAPITQAGWNPARDFGPRIVAYFAGWGSVAIPGPHNGFWTYIIGPMVGAPVGGLIRDLFFETAHHKRD